MANNKTIKTVDYTQASTIYVTRAGCFYTCEGKKFDSYGTYISKCAKKGVKYEKTKEDYVKKVVCAGLPKPIITIHQNNGYSAIGFSLKVVNPDDSYKRCLVFDLYRQEYCYAANKFTSNPKLIRGSRWCCAVGYVFYTDGSFVAIMEQVDRDRAHGDVVLGRHLYVYNPKYQGSQGYTYYTTFAEMRACVDDEGNRRVVAYDPDHPEYYRTYSVKNTSKKKHIYTSYFMDLTKGDLYASCTDIKPHGPEMKMSEETQRTIEEFFHLDDPWSGDDVAMRDQYIYRTKKEHIEDFNDLIDYSYGKVSGDRSNSAATSKVRREEILATRFRDEFTFDTEKSRHLLWDRFGDEVVATIWHDSQDGTWGHRSEERAVFIYNVKTKARTLAILTADASTPKILVPSLKMILDTLDTTPHSNYDYQTSRSTPIHEQWKPTLLKPFDEVFKDTNVSVLRNTPEASEILTLKYEDRNSWGYYDDEGDHLATVGSQLADDSVYIFAIYVLVGSSEPFREQLIKCGLYHLYLASMEFDDHFRDPKHDAKLVNRRYGWNEQLKGIPVYKKAKNIKKAFLMTMQQVRLLDEFVGRRYAQAYENKNDKSVVQWDKVLPNLVGASEFIGMDLNKIDMKAFESILELGSTPYRYNRVFSWELNDTPEIKEAVSTLPIIQKVKFLASISDLQSYNDYLSMRKKMEAISKVNEEARGAYDPTSYPIRPRACSKFFRYFQGARDGWRTINNEGDFKRFVIQGKYPKAAQEGRVVYYFDEYRRLVGAMVTMTAEENATALHDELSIWVSLYQDASKNALFKEAIGRVLPLEYTNGELSIVAPRTVNDLQTEGRVLSHCVASFVDPIIDGTTNVLFVRRNDMINVPFYTIEILNDGTVRQVHCYRNGDVSEAGQREAYERSVADGQEVPSYNKTFDVAAFLIEWSKKRKSVKQQSIKLQYGALCAYRGN